MTVFKLGVLGGDGVGPEVIAEAVKVLRAMEGASEHRFELTEDVVGGAAIDAYGTALRPETVQLAKRSDAVLFGAVGGPFVLLAVAIGLLALIAAIVVLCVMTETSV